MLALLWQISLKTYMDTERYLFLDFDGVLNTMEYQTALQWKGHGWEDSFGTLLIQLQ